MNTDNMISETVSFHPSSNVLIVDASYYIFYRFFATYRWYSFKTKDESKAGTLTQDPNFVSAFIKHMQQDIQKWRKQWSIVKDNIFFCFDCSQKDIWRNVHHDNYKGGRTQAAHFDGNIFVVFYEWFDKNATNFGITSLAIDCLEADDVAYLCVQKILPQLEESKIIVLTNDNDYLQMRSEKVSIINAQGHDLAKRSIGTAEQDLIYKILMGDSSDNIPAVCSRLGAATAKKLALASEEERWAWIQKKGIECEKAYRNNERLISFHHIPKQYMDEWNMKYVWCKK